MFGQMKQITTLMTKLPQMKEEFAKFQAKSGEMFAEGKAGDLISVTVNGKFVVTSCRVSDEAAKLQDPNKLALLISEATNSALQQMRKLLADEVARVGSELGLPPGFSLPGIG